MRVNSQNVTLGLAIMVGLGGCKGFEIVDEPVELASSSKNSTINSPARITSVSISRDLMIPVTISSDAQAERWCLTETFEPLMAESCNGGQGPLQGWYSTRPTQFLLSTGDGTKTIYLKVANTNSVSPLTSVQITLDQTRPAFSLTRAPESVTTQTSAQFEFTATDSGSGFQDYVCFHNGLSVNCQGSTTLQGLLEGSHSFAMAARDRAGNMSDPVTIHWRIDRTSPQVSFSQRPSQYSNSSEATFAFQGTDSESGIRRFECRLNNGSFQECSSPHTLRNLSEGSHTFTIRAYDGAGNVSDEDSDTWVVDRTPPTIQITSRPPNPTATTSAVFQFSGTDANGGVQFRCRLNNGTESSCSSPHSVSLANGTHTFAVRSIDGAGNRSAWTEYRWTIQQATPGIILGDGNLPDVAIWRSHIWVAYQFDQTLIVRNIDTGESRSYPLAPESLSFARLGVWNDTLYVIYRDGVNAVLRNLVNESSEVLSSSGGNDPVAIGHQWIAWQDLASNRVLRRAITGGAVTDAAEARPTGISRILENGVIVSIDEDRFLFEGYTRPCFTPTMTAVEGVETGVIVIRPNRPNLTIWEGLITYTPRCSSDNSRHAIVTWGGFARDGLGVRLMTLPAN